MPTQDRKWYSEWWYITAAGQKSKRPPIVASWAGPVAVAFGGNFGVNEQATWGGPDAVADAGVFEASRSADWQGPEADGSTALFSALETANWGGPDASGAGGTFGATEEAEYAGPAASGAGGSFSALELANWSGPDASGWGGNFGVNEEATWGGPDALGAGGSFSALELASWVGPDAQGAGGSFDVAEAANWSGPDALGVGGSFAALETANWSGSTAVGDGGSWAAHEYQSWGGPDASGDAGSFGVLEFAVWMGPGANGTQAEFTASENASWAGPDAIADGGSFNVAEAALWSGPDAQGDGGNFGALELASWTGPDSDGDGGTFGALELANWAGPDASGDDGAYSVNIESLWQGPLSFGEGGTFDALELASWAGPDATADGGAFGVAEMVYWSGPDAQGDGGAFSALELASWSGPDASGDAGTFSSAEAALWSGPDALADGGTFTAAEPASWAGPDASAAGGAFDALETASWTGPDALGDAGTFSTTEASSWAGPDALGEGGTFTSSDGAFWAGPDATGEGGTFSASEAASWTGPDAIGAGGTFTAAEPASWAGPAADAAGGSFSALETAAWAGPGSAADGGTFAVDEGASWAGPDSDADGGTFTSTVLTIANWAGPEADGDGGTFTATELASWAGPEADADGGTFGVGETASWSGPDATADGGTFTYSAALAWAGPEATGNGGTFDALETAAWSGPEADGQSGTFTATESALWSGPVADGYAGFFTFQAGEPLAIASGTLYAFATEDSGSYLVGGDFTNAYPGADGMGGLSVLAISDAARNAIAYVNGPVHTIISNGAGGAYIGGEFTYVNNTPRARLAEINSSGAVTSWNPGCDGIVYVLVRHTGLSVSGNSVLIYVGGRFNSCGGATNYNLAAVTTAGVSLSGWSVAVAGSTATDYAGAAVYAIKEHPTNSGFTVQFGGRFGFNNGLVRQNSSGFTPNQLGPTLPASPYVTKGGSAANATVYALSYMIRANTGQMHRLVGGDFDNFDGLTRYNLAGRNTSTGVNDGDLYGCNGPVYALAQTTHLSTGTTFIGGAFTLFGRDSSADAGIGKNARSRIASWTHNAASPFLPTSWNPGASSTVRGISYDGTHVYAAGAFTTFGGVPAKRVAKCLPGSSTAVTWNTTLDVASESVSAVAAGTFFGASNALIGGSDLTTSDKYVSGVENVLRIEPDGSLGLPLGLDCVGTVRALLRAGDTLYVAGQFQSVSGVTGYKGLARYNLLTGALDTGWKPTSSNSNPIYNALGYRQGYLYVGGDINSSSAATNIGGSGQDGLARIDVATGAGDATWMPNLTSASYAQVKALHVDNSRVIVAGSFTGLGGAAQNALGAVNTTNGSAAGWMSFPAQSVNDIAVLDNALYAVGPFTSSGGVARSYAAKYDVNTGALDTSFVPTVPAAGRSVLATQQAVYIGNDALRAYALTDGASVPGVDVQTDGTIFRLGLYADNLVVALGSFTSVAGEIRATGGMYWIRES